MKVVDTWTSFPFPVRYLIYRALPFGCSMIAISLSTTTAKDNDSTCHRLCSCSDLT